VANVYLALGANIGNREANLRLALRLMTRLCRVRAASSLYETEPAEGAPPPPYYNAVCLVETGLEPLPLLRFLKGLEDEIGRRPGPPGAPRPCDLDILLYEDRVLDSPELTVPHPRHHERAFVLQPLAEIAPDARHPLLGRTIAELAAEVGGEGVRRVAERGWDGVAGQEPGRVRI